MDRDPQRQLPPGYDPIRGGLLSLFVPQGTVGCLAGFFILIAISIGIGLLQGFWLALGVFCLVGLVPLTIRAVRRELGRDARPGNRRRRQAPLPEDSEISDWERRQAQRSLERLDDEDERGRR